MNKLHSAAIVAATVACGHMDGAKMSGGGVEVKHNDNARVSVTPEGLTAPNDPSRFCNESTEFIKKQACYYDRLVAGALNEKGASLADKQTFVTACDDLHRIEIINGLPVNKFVKDSLHQENTLVTDIAHQRNNCPDGTPERNEYDQAAAEANRAFQEWLRTVETICE